MKRTRFFISLILLFSICLSVFSQANSIFTPFVSRIKIQQQQSSIKISWKDTPDVEGNCIIYRHNSILSADNLSDAVKIARVPKGVEYYEDFPPYTHTDYYYLVLMEDNNSLLHEVFIPFRNMSSRASYITEKTQDDSPALITAIKAWAGKDSVQLSFKCSKPSAELFIYRNTSPIEDEKDILEANLIATLSGTSSSFNDYPVPGIGYYYAVIDSNLIKTGSYVFKAGENITMVPVELELESTERIGLPEIPASRPKPLPYLSISRGYQSGRQLSASVIDSIPEREDISGSTADAVDKLRSIAVHDEPAVLKAVILKQDQHPESGSERAMLYDILTADFLSGEFESARVKLSEFQQIRRAKELEASIHYYLGQINYFLGDYKTAFTEFLFAEEYYFLESKPWIDSIFKKMRRSDY